MNTNTALGTTAAGPNDPPIGYDPERDIDPSLLAPRPSGTTALAPNGAPAPPSPTGSLALTHISVPSPAAGPAGLLYPNALPPRPRRRRRNPHALPGDDDYEEEPAPPMDEDEDQDEDDWSEDAQEPLEQAENEETRLTHEAELSEP